MFIDEAKLKIKAWKWWDWIVSWRRERCIPKWWPWGWDWWDGWNVYLETAFNLNTLSDYRNRKEMKAKNWDPWLPDNAHWANGQDLVLKVPVWTIVKNSETWELVCDLDKPNMRVKLLEWWRWGFWNSHFVSSTRQAPWFAELWDVWKEWTFSFELKLVADIWIIWIPSAWKSTLISVLTNVKPKVWDYPFTTLVPNLWVLDHKWKSIVLEDVPGLIEWASEWKGLWIDFLKHIERTWAIMHLLDLYRLDEIFDDYDKIRNELEKFSKDLSNKEEIIVFSKADLLDEEMISFVKSEFVKKYWEKKFFVVSSASSIWLSELKDYLIDNYAEKAHIVDEHRDEDFTVYNLKDSSNARDVDVSYIWDLLFEAKWDRLEQIVRMTNFDNFEAVMRVYDVLDKLWVIKKVESRLRKILEIDWIDNSFYFEWNDAEEIDPRIKIGDKVMSLDKMKFKI